jgi:hypothetical protein
MKRSADPFAKITRTAILAKGQPKPFAQGFHLPNHRGANGTSAQMLFHLSSEFRRNGVFEVSRGYLFEFLAIHRHIPLNTVIFAFLSI